MLGAVLAAVTVFSFGDVDVRCEKPGDWTIKAERAELGKGVETLKITLDAPSAAVPPRFEVGWKIPQVDVSNMWSVNEPYCSLRPNWGGWKYSALSYHMPLYVYFNGNDRSRFSVAASECVRHLAFCGGVLEEGCFVESKFVYFDSAEAPLAHYETEIRFDTRDLFFGDAVRDGVKWMEEASGCTPCVPPAAAFDPLYSSWYDFHQDVRAADIEAECAIAAKLGMKVLILDDGWQTDDTNRGYAFCGDWEVSKKRFPDFAAHVAKVQAMGMKYMVWYSVPFVGFKSVNYARFKGKYLREDVHQQAAVLDPRFPEVRKFLVDTYVKAVKDANLDGLKLDFINSFSCDGVDPAVAEDYAGRDVKSVPLAVDKLMTEVRAALVALKPDVLIEFRQPYNGPAIRTYGNMLRVGDCPGDMRQNRVSIASMRLASGGSAVHADMLEWNCADTPASAARNIINSIFGVVQYSAMLRDVPPDHLAMIGKWIRFSQDHSDTLLHGAFRPHHPELLYPVIEAEGEDEIIIAVYDDGRLVDVPSGKKAFLLNATGKDALVIRRDGRISEIACPSGDWAEL